MNPISLVVHPTLLPPPRIFEQAAGAYLGLASILTREGLSALAKTAAGLITDTTEAFAALSSETFIREIASEISPESKLSDYYRSIKVFGCDSEMLGCHTLVSLGIGVVALESGEDFTCPFASLERLCTTGVRKHVLVADCPTDASDLRCFIGTDGRNVEPGPYMVCRGSRRDIEGTSGGSIIVPKDRRRSRHDMPWAPYPATLGEPNVAVARSPSLPKMFLSGTNPWVEIETVCAEMHQAKTSSSARQAWKCVHAIRKWGGPSNEDRERQSYASLAANTLADSLRVFVLAFTLFMAVPNVCGSLALVGLVVTFWDVYWPESGTASRIVLRPWGAVGDGLERVVRMACPIDPYTHTGVCGFKIGRGEFPKGRRGGVVHIERDPVRFEPVFTSGAPVSGVEEGPGGIGYAASLGLVGHSRNSPASAF